MPLFQKSYCGWLILVLVYGLGQARPATETHHDEGDKIPTQLEGPGREAPVVEDSESLPAWELPMEHRHDVAGAITLPDNRGISPAVYASLGVDLFFSMWFIFLNNDVRYSDTPFTILAPVNSSKTFPETILENEALAEEIIANHFLLGEEIRPETLATPKERYTGGGQRLNFKVDREGELWVNDVAILGWAQVPNGVIFSLSDYLYTEHIEPDLKAFSREIPEQQIGNEIVDGKESSANVTTVTTAAFTTFRLASTTTTTTTTTRRTTTTTTVPRTTTVSYFPAPKDDWLIRETCEVVQNKLSGFRRVLVCVEEYVDPSTLDEEKRKEVRSDDSDVKNHAGEAVPTLKRNDDEEELPIFVQDIVDVLSVLRFGSNDYLAYIQSADIRDAFTEGGQYTALIPFDEAFRAWYPIDWGFNPFQVDSFLRQTLLNHFLVGAVDQSNVVDGATFKTLGGEDVTFHRRGNVLSVNGIELLEGGTPIDHGTMLFIDQLLFVDRDKVDELNEEYPFLESGPLLPAPWYESQFLSHALRTLSEREEYTYMVEYMNATHELGSYAPGYDDNGRTDGFTLFVPRDDAFWRLLVQDATVPDPFLTLPEFRLRTLLGHLVQERLFSKDMVVGATIPTTANKTLTVKDVSDGRIILDDGRQNITAEGNEVFIYNLGNLYFVDKVLFTETSDVVKAMEKLPVLKSGIAETEVADILIKSQEGSETSMEVSKEDFVEDFGPPPAATKVAVDGESGGDGSDQRPKTREEAVEKLKIKESQALQSRENPAEVSPPAKTATVDFPGQGWKMENLEEKVIFINNQKISILKQKEPMAVN